MKPKQDRVIRALHADQAQARSRTAPFTQGETEARGGRKVTQLVRVRIPSLDLGRDSDITKGNLPAPGPAVPSPEAALARFSRALPALSTRIHISLLS